MYRSEHLSSNPFLLRTLRLTSLRTLLCSISPSVKVYLGFPRQILGCRPVPAHGQNGLRFRARTQWSARLCCLTGASAVNVANGLGNVRVPPPSSESPVSCQSGTLIGAFYCGLYRSEHLHMPARPANDRVQRCRCFTSCAVRHRLPSPSQRTTTGKPQLR